MQAAVGADALDISARTVQIMALPSFDRNVRVVAGADAFYVEASLSDYLRETVAQHLG
jgi:hypothetical protein